MQSQQQREPVKQVYAAPAVTDYGTLKEQTAAGNTSPSGADGGTFSS